MIELLGVHRASMSPPSPVSIESLEGRVLLSGFHAQLNFQPAAAAVPAGWVADTGRAFADRGNGFAYGWNVDNSANARDRNASLSPDQRYDTLNHMQKPGGGSVWSIAVPNGLYDVRVVAGDPAATDSVYRINAEGVLAVSGTPTPGQPWFDGSVRVNVTDGALTVSNGSGAVNNKINFVDITSAAASVGVRSPFGGTAVSLPGTIEAEHFDEGGEGVAYHDLDPVNHGTPYRNTGVDLNGTTDAGGGYTLGWTYAGEWLEYTVNVPTAGTFDLQARVASNGNGGRFHVAVDGVDRSGQLTIPNTGSWSNFTTLTKSSITLSAGQHVVRLALDANGATTAVGSINWLKFVPHVSAPVSWRAGTPSPLTRSEGSGAVVNGKVYVFGGFLNDSLAVTRQMDVYDPASNSWSRAADIPVTMTHASAAVDGHTIWVAGLFLHDGVSSSALVYKYNADTNTWSQGPSLPDGRGAGAMAVVGRELHYWGGLKINRLAAADHWRLNLDNPTGWTRDTPLPEAVDHMAGESLNGKLYSIGGIKDKIENTSNMTTVRVYNPATRQWSLAAPLPFGRGHIGPATTVAAGKIVIAGGQINGNGEIIIRDVTQYDPATNKWSALPLLPTARKSSVSAYAGGQLIVTTGNAPSPSNQTYITPYPS